MDWESLVNEIYNETTGIEFSWDMTLRAFFKWLLDQPISTYAYIIGVIACIIFINKCLNWLRNNDKNQ